MTCLPCAHLDLKSHPAHSNIGFGRCKFDGVGEFRSMSYQHECSKFKEADAEIVAARIKWRKGKA